MVFVTLLPKKESKGSRCFRHEVELVTRTLSDADGIVDKVETVGLSSRVIEGRTVATIEKLSFTVADLPAGEVRALLHEVEEQISLQGEGVRILVSTTGFPLAV